MKIVKRDEKPWRTIQGIEFRSITVVAHKGKQGPCWERRQAVIYRGPWRKVIDDDGHVLERGRRMANHAAHSPGKAPIIPASGPANFTSETAARTALTRSSRKRAHK